MGQIHNEIEDSKLYFHYISVLSKSPKSFTDIQKQINKSKSIVHRQLKYLLDSKLIKLNIETKKYDLNDIELNQRFLRHYLLYYEKSKKKKLSKDKIPRKFEDNEIIPFLIRDLINNIVSFNLAEILRHLVYYFSTHPDNDYEYYFERTGIMEDHICFDYFTKTTDFKILMILRKNFGYNENYVVESLEKFYSKEYQIYIESKGVYTKK